MPTLSILPSSVAAMGQQVYYLLDIRFFLCDDGDLVQKEKVQKLRATTADRDKANS